MKQTILLFLFVSEFAFGQVQSEYTKIDSVQYNKAQLFGFAKSWFSEVFKSGESVIDMEDKDLGRLIGNGKMAYRQNSPFGNQVGLDVISFQMNIDTKDNKYKITIKNIKHNYIQTATVYNPSSRLLTSMGNSMANSRNGGLLTNEKPDCGWLVTKKQWAELKKKSDEYAKHLLDDFDKYIKSQKTEW